ncbi:MAG: glycosyltransferase family 2 protein [Cyanobacteria bacterium CRU_2_1]|nr:glycosyltransferase family 2 protein [Cyanobacteria bacterium CRU_2_1]
MNTAVALLIFNRPDKTERVLESIRQVKPPKLFVVADGPRPDHPDDVHKCAASRSVIEQVDWDCEVIKNYSDVNMGCGLRISTGLDWVFDQEEMVIILEDDCIPQPTFFGFCEELLERYEDDERIMMICGYNPLTEWKSHQQSYHFSYISVCWGWASWRRAWKYYDFHMELWLEPEVKNRIRDVIGGQRNYLLVERIFDTVHAGKIDTWAFRWFFTRLSQSGLVVTSSTNLVENVGFGEDATHWKKKNADPKRLAQAMSFPLRHPLVVAPDRDYDNMRYKQWRGTLVDRSIKNGKRFLRGIKNSVFSSFSKYGQKAF